MWCMLCSYLLLISNSFGASGGQCVMIVTFHWCPFIFYMDLTKINEGTPERPQSQSTVYLIYTIATSHLIPVQPKLTNMDLVK